MRYSRISNVRLLHLGKRLIALSRSIASHTPRPNFEKANSAPNRTLHWLHTQEQQGGIRVHSRHRYSYPEVTGYLIPTLIECGDQEFAVRLVNWLLAIQRGNGAFPDPDQGEDYVFDTGQVLRGLLSCIPLVPGTKAAAQLAAEYICSQVIEEGLKGFKHRYSGLVPETVHLYVLPALVNISHELGIPKYATIAENCLKYYITSPDFLQPSSLTHFLGYELEALIDLGRADLALPTLNWLESTQKADGSIPAAQGKRWVCTPGLAQIAICWYKLEHWQPADKAMDWLEKHQQPSGGYLGSYGYGAKYFPNEELSWAAKFYLDAHRLRVASFFDRNADIFPSYVGLDDGRLQAILSVVRPYEQILEVGCGKGRFLRALSEVHPSLRCTGVDISMKLLESLPSNIKGFQGSQERIPCDDSSFDVVFSVEAIEHSMNSQAAVAEMIRVLRPGGWLIIIDKQESHTGQLSRPVWERWPNRRHFHELLNRYCDCVTSNPVSYDNQNDNLMIAWKGQKRSRLSGEQWNPVIISSRDSQDRVRKVVVERLRHNQLTEWGQTVILATKPGQAVLEIGSGTGEISLQLALTGRRVTALDVNPDSLEFTRACANDLGVELYAIAADAVSPLPFQANAFDCVWSSGLLEHFTCDERRDMLRTWARVTKGMLISIVPNASSLAYRVGKEEQEKAGLWPYGLETPIQTLRTDYEAVGLEVIQEYSVGVDHALSFLEHQHPLRRSLTKWLRQVDHNDLESYNQGYLLVTIGIKKAEISS